MKKQFRTILLLFTDTIFILLSYYIGLLLRFDGEINQFFLDVYINNIYIILVIKIFFLYIFKLYNSLWEHASITELIQVFFASITSNITIYLFMLVQGSVLPRTVYIMGMILDIFFFGAARLNYRILRRMKDLAFFTDKKLYKRIMIVGAGSAGAMLIKEIKYSTKSTGKIIALLDDDKNKYGKFINGIKVRGSVNDIEHFAKKLRIDQIIIAIPSASKSRISDIIKECEKTECELKILPYIYELVDGKINVKQLRDVQIEDLLGREEVEINIDEITGYINNKTVLVTGGGGSIGSELCRQIMKFNPIKLIVLDIYENSLYDLHNELTKKDYGKKIIIEEIIASVRDERTIDEIFREHRPDVVFHAAAHKHVPLMEKCPKEAIKNNIFGTYNVVKASDKYGVNKFVLISTDKAVNPTNIMGATKRISEIIIQAYNSRSKTEFVAVRFGNVLGSNGSVIPLFKKQILEGGPITVTHEKIERYFMTIPEAVKLVIQAGSMANGGELFILDMGEPVKIIDLAKRIIKLSGLELDKDISIKIIGLRPGEKLYEELFLDKEKINKTKHKSIFIEEPKIMEYEELANQLEKLKENIDNDKIEYKIIQKLVPTYKNGYNNMPNQ